MKVFLVFALFVPALSALVARPAGEVVEYGIFEPLADEIHFKPGDAGMTTITGKIKFVKKTAAIPARLGVRFGIRFLIWGLAGAGEIELTKVIKHPPIKGPDGKVMTTLTRKIRFRPVRGTIMDFSGFMFEHKYEMVPGLWIFQYWYLGELLLEQKFIVK